MVVLDAQLVQPLEFFLFAVSKHHSLTSCLNQIYEYATISCHVSSATTVPHSCHVPAHLQ